VERSGGERAHPDPARLRRHRGNRSRGCRLRRPLGAFIGAFIYVILQVFSSDVLGVFGFSSERFKLIIGIGFLAIVLFSPDGVLGLWDRWRTRANRRADPLTGGPR